MTYYRAFYLPKKGSYQEEIVDSYTTPDELPSGALLVISIDNDTGIREVISEKKGKLTEKEQYFFDYAKRQLEKKHDGGGTLEHAALMRTRRDWGSTRNG